jgi:hypothetical protein
MLDQESDVVFVEVAHQISFIPALNRLENIEPKV